MTQIQTKPSASSATSTDTEGQPYAAHVCIEEPHLLQPLCSLKLL